MSKLITAGGAGLLTLALASAASAQERAMTPADLFELKTVLSAAMSPDGSHVAYRLADPRDVVDGGEENGPADVHLWIAEIGGEPRPYVTGEVSVGDVEWRPETGTVTFLARRDGDDHVSLYEIDPTGGEAMRLHQHENAIADHVWSPDGETVFFIGEAAEDADAEARAERGFNARIYEEQLDHARVWRLDLDGGAGEAEMFDLDGDASALAMSNGGDVLAVGLAPTPLVDDLYMKRRWHLVDAADGDVRAVVETPGKTGPVVFSPDDERLAMLVGADAHDTTAGTLAIADADTGEYELIARGAEQHVMDMQWIDEANVLALAHVSVDSALVTYGLDGTERGRIAQEDVVLRSIDLHRPTGRFAAVADAPTHPREAFTGLVEDGSLTRLHDHNPQLADIVFGDQRAFQYESRDGLTIEGVLITPDGRRPRGGWPLILAVHGGPEAHDSDGWLTSYSDPGHIGAGKGYAVFYPNYRGSTGRGETFTKLHQADYAGGEFNDLVDGVEALAAEGLIDRDRVGITGGSYGGYASMWGATALTEHFAAAVAFVGISDQISKFGTTDIPNEMYLVHSRAWPWEDWTNLLERSPIFHAPQSQTPTLILHGEEDTRVHPSQSMELYRFMKVATDTPVRLVFYPGEGHGNRNAAAQYDYAHRMLRWFDHYLTGEGGEPPAADLDWTSILPDEAD